MAITRIPILLAAASLATVAAAPAALAHVLLERREAPAGAAYKAVLVVPHGCAGAATTAIRVTVPEGVFAVKPQPKPGWQLAVTTAPYARAYTSHGREVREGVREIAWTGGRLDDGHYDEFVFVGQIDGAVSGTLHFPVVQTCEGTEARWTEVPRPGERAQQPAPALSVIAASGERPLQGPGTPGHGAPAAAGSGQAAAVTKGALRIIQPWTRATPGGARVAGGYLTVTNTGTEPDRLIGGSAAFADRVEVHEMATVNGVMTMRGLADGLVIAPGATVELRPGGYHLMFLGLKDRLSEGQTVKVTLTFERAGPVELDVPVGSLGGRSAPGGGGHGHH